MKFLVISDTHGNIDLVINYIDNHFQNKKEISGIFFLGDYVEDGENIEDKLGIKTYIVAGNGDFKSDYPDDLLLKIKGKTIMLTHGHKYRLGYNLDTLTYKGLEVKADLILYGHTHVPVITSQNNILIINPGSPSYPRTSNNKKTIAAINFTEEIKAEIIDIGLYGGKNEI